MEEEKKVFVVIPTYDEAATLPILVEELFSLPVPGLSLVIVDDASPDGTGELADRLARRSKRMEVLHRPGRLGLASAYREGFHLALELGADVVLQMDADLSHAPGDVPRLLEKLQSHDVAVGSRYVPGGGADPAWGWRRRLLSRAANLYARWVAGVRVKDATSGFKGFRRTVLEALPWDKMSCRGFVFQVAVAWACQRLGYRVVEVPIIFGERGRGRSKMSFAIVMEAVWRVWGLRCLRL